MIVSPYRTSVTAAHQDTGKYVEPKAEPKFRSHGYVSPKRMKPSDYDCSEPPRTREGQNYAGGKQLRRRMKKLGIRKASFVPHMPNVKQTKCHMPGSMN